MKFDLGRVSRGPCENCHVQSDCTDCPCPVLTPVRPDESKGGDYVLPPGETTIRILPPEGQEFNGPGHIDPFGTHPKESVKIRLNRRELQRQRDVRTVWQADSRRCEDCGKTGNHTHVVINRTPFVHTPGDYIDRDHVYLTDDDQTIIADLTKFAESLLKLGICPQHGDLRNCKGAHDDAAGYEDEPPAVPMSCGGTGTCCDDDWSPCHCSCHA
jgi:hypothetical protein